MTLHPLRQGSQTQIRWSDVLTSPRPPLPLAAPACFRGQDRGNPGIRRQASETWSSYMEVPPFPLNRGVNSQRLGVSIQRAPAQPAAESCHPQEQRPWHGTVLKLTWSPPPAWSPAGSCYGNLMTL
ncbi:uncharacterized protein LOC144389440 [Gasterosteus aculeatus]